MNLKVENSCEKKDVRKGIRGITLIALVVTIIVLLILAGISIMMLTGQNGILTRANQAKENMGTAQTEELINLSVTDALTQGLGSLTDENLKASLNNNIGAGKYTITGDATNGWTVTVDGKRYNIDASGTISSEKITLASGLEITPSTITIEQAATSELTVTQQGGGNEDIEWTSSSENVGVIKKDENTATITGKAIGSATITATAKSSGKTATCSVTVKAPTYIDSSYVEYNVGYKDIYTNTEYTRLTGWRLLSQKTNAEDSTKVDIEIISTGIPAGLYYHYGYIAQESYNLWAGTPAQIKDYKSQYYTSGSNTNPNMYAASGLRYNFKKIVLKQQIGDTTNSNGQYNTGYYTKISNNGKDQTGDNITGATFIASDIDSSKAEVRSVMHSDITGSETSSSITVTDPDDKAGLFILQNYTPDKYSFGWYWLASPYPNSNDVYSVYFSGNVGNGTPYRGGLRPVIFISGVKLQRMEGNSNVWKITN